MASPPLRAYKVVRDALLGLRPSLIELPDDAAAAEKWVLSFSGMLDLAASVGSNASINASTDPEVAKLLEDVRGRLLQYATVSWIEHSPRVVAGMEETLRRIASTLARTLSIPPAATTETGSSAGPSVSDFLLLGEYARQVKGGSMTLAEFDKRRDGLFKASPDPHRVHSPSATVSPSSSHATAPIPAMLGLSIPSSSSLALSAAPAVVASPPGATTSPAPRPVRHAAVPTAAGLVEPAPARRAGHKRARSADLMNTSTKPNYTRCDHCTRNKVRCAPRVGASPPYICARCEDADRPCIRQAYVRRRRKVQSRLRRVAQPPPPLVPAQGASSLLMGGGVSVSHVESAVSVVVWRAELARATAARELAEKQEQFAQERYAEALERVIAPVATTVDEPQSKRARAVLGSLEKGKGKARPEVIEEHDDEEEEKDELADAGESEVDEVES